MELMAKKLTDLKQAIDETAPGDEPPWKVYGRIKLKTGISLAAIDEDETVSSEEYEEIRTAAEEVMGEPLPSVRRS